MHRQAGAISPGFMTNSPVSQKDDVIDLHVHDELIEKLWYAYSRAEVRRTIHEWISGYSDNERLIAERDEARVTLREISDAAREVVAAVDQYFDPEVRVGPVWPTTQRLRAVLTAYQSK
jgi:hypothetical protein